MKQHNRYLEFTDMWLLIDATSAKYFYPKLSELGLIRGQPKMLRFLGENNGCIQADISNRFHLRAASVSGILNTMEKAGLIEKMINPDCRREKLVFLTDLGKEKLAEVNKLYDKINAELFNEFTNEEFETLMKYLRKFERICEDKIENNLTKRRNKK